MKKISTKLSPLPFLKENGNSKFKEKFAEYSFLKDLYLAAAKQNETFLVSRSDFDSFSYDIIIESKTRAKVLFIQLKSFAGKASTWDVHKVLLKNKFGRVILVSLVDEGNGLIIKYLMFNPENTKEAINKPPKVAHPDKCKTNKGEYFDITNNLMSIFN
jgi:hypothetical protein